MPEVDINYLTVLVAAAVALALGALWYSPVLLGKPWMAAIGKTEEEIKSSSRSMPLIFGLTFLAWLVTAYVLAHIVDYAVATTVSGGLQTGFWTWLGFMITYEVIHGLFEEREVRLLFINSGYHLVAILIMGGMLAAWM